MSAIAEQVTKCFEVEELFALKNQQIPIHVAIIMDGNRRFAEKIIQSESIEGHKAGADRLIEIVTAAKELGVKYLTLYAFSTENWQRPQEEVLALLWLFENYIYKYIPKLCEQEVRFNTIGNLSRFPAPLLKAIDSAKQATKNFEEMEIIFAMNYGARDELVRAVKNIVQSLSEKKLEISEICENLITDYLDTAKYPDPELIIRTGGEKRLSNFLLWQASYAEIYSTETLWPDFSPQALLIALLDYQKRKRRFGT